MLIFRFAFTSALVFLALQTERNCSGPFTAYGCIGERLKNRLRANCRKTVREEFLLISAESSSVSAIAVARAPKAATAAVVVVVAVAASTATAADNPNEVAGELEIKPGFTTSSDCFR